MIDRYRERVNNSSIRQKTARVNFKLKEVPKRFPIYFKALLAGQIFSSVGNQVKSTDSKAMIMIFIGGGNLTLLNVCAMKHHQ